MEKVDQEHPVTLIDTSAKCHCGSYLLYIEKVDETIGTGGGLTDIIDNKRYYLDPDLLPPDWTPTYPRIRKGMGEFFHYTSSPT